MVISRLSSYHIRLVGTCMALAGLLLIGTSHPVMAQSLKDAQAAYDAGNHDEAIATLRDVLSNKKKNDKDLLEVPSQVRRMLTFVAVETVDEVLAVALVPQVHATP